jgi:thymidylate synthase (FAD)
LERKNTNLRVTLIAKTEANYLAMMDATDHEYDPSGFDEGDGIRHLDVTNDCDSVPVFGGRSCYQSWDKPNPDTATELGYLDNILAQGHYSVLEHSSATFYVTGVSRNMTHELIRHRHLSYSELSQRYCDMEETPVVIPPALQEETGGRKSMRMPWGIARDYRMLVDRLNTQGLKRKQARETARYMLPGGTETRIVVTGNMRAWRDFLGKRWHVAADAEIREFAGEILTELKSIAPGCFQDFDTTTPIGG